MKKIKIYFLFHSKAFWPSWETFWDACNKDPRIETKMIYCPVPIKQQDKGCYGQFVGAESWLKKNNIQYFHIRTIDFKTDKPDVLIIQTPYDAHRKKIYSSDNFNKMGIKIIYISYGLEFTEAKENIINHFQLPIHSNSWRIFTASPLISDDYKKFCPRGNNHIRYYGHPKFDFIKDKNHFKLPKRIIKKASGRKIIVWKVHFPMQVLGKNGQIYNSTFSWENDKKILDYIKKQKDLFFVFLPHHLFFGVLQYKFNISVNEINKFKQNLEKNDNSTIWYDDYRPIISCCDAYMGERSSVTFEIIAYDKPVLYLEEKPEIYNNFGKIILKSYESTKSIKGVKIFLEKIKKGIDTKKREREQSFNHVFPNFNNNSGYKIKENIVYDLQQEECELIKFNNNKLNQEFKILKSKNNKLNQECKILKSKNNKLNQECKILKDSKFYIPYKIYHKLKLKIKS